MSDAEVSNTIEKLVAEEHELLAQPPSDERHERLETVKVELDRRGGFGEAILPGPPIGGSIQDCFGKLLAGRALAQVESGGSAGRAGGRARLRDRELVDHHEVVDASVAHALDQGVGSR